MDENAVVDELYAGSRDSFLPTRTERSKQARAAGDREMAARIAALRKPTVGAWLVNQVVRRHPARVAELAELAERMRTAHQHGDGEQIRAAGRDRQALLRDLAATARQIAAAEGTRLGADAAGQVTTTFQAALVDPAALAAVRTGCLAATVEQDADLMGLLPEIDAPAPMWSSRPRPAAPVAPAAVAPAPVEEAPVEVAPVAPPPSRELIEASQREEECAAARERAEQELTAAQNHATRTREVADETRARFNEAREAHDAALAAVAAARATLATAEREARAAHQAVVALRD
jgi:hypothetical protein